MKQFIQEAGSTPIRLWTDDIEEQAVAQLKAAAQLPCVHPHGLAAMADAHMGIGSTVGTVLATKGAVVPAAVGVDIGCFSGNTKVPLLDGSQQTLADLAARTEPFWVYSINDRKVIVPGKATALKTRENAELVIVTVSGGDEIVCTPDHQFMLNDGTYREAKDLRFNQSLMPLYRRWQTRDGYESVSSGKSDSKQTHVMVWEAFNGPVPQGHVVHHVDHIHFNNQPGNLELMTVSDHSAYHRSVGHKIDNDSPVFRERRLAGVKRRKEDPVKRQQMADTGAQNIAAHMRDRPEEYRAAVADNGKRGAPYLAAFNTSPRACKDCDHVSQNPSAHRWHVQKEHAYNHKVLSVRPAGYTADVYCLQVEEHHNFALAAGVFVHNCGMIAVRTSLREVDLPDSLKEFRHQVERDVPLGPGGAHSRHSDLEMNWDGRQDLLNRFDAIVDNAPIFKRADQRTKMMSQLGSLGSGNHFIELCVDESGNVWIMLHSGSRGTGNQVGMYYIEKAKREAERWMIKLPSDDLAYLPEGSEHFDNYIAAMLWSQDYALNNRQVMMRRVIAALQRAVARPFTVTDQAVECHHNYCEKEHHFGENVWVTRKGAIRARDGDLGIIPGAMGRRSYIVRGLGNKESYCSAPHGAGRRMSRSAARKQFTIDDIRAQTEGLECRKDLAVADEIAGCYKDVDEVMANSSDLVEIMHALRAVVCVKGA